MSSSGTAQANSACQMLDNIIHTVSVIEVMSAPKNAENHSNNMAVLDTTLKQIAVQTLQPDIYKKRFKTESLSLDRYISALKITVTQRASDSPRQSLERLTTAYTPEVSRSLQSLNNYWSCNKNTPNTPPIDAEGMGGKTGSSLTARKTVKDTLKGTTSGNGERSAGSALAAQGKRVYTNTNPEFKPNYFALVIVAFLGLFGLLYYRRKRSRAREHRRIINTAVPISLNKKTANMIMVDITRNGFKVEHAGLIETQKKLRVQLNGRWHSGQIMWRNAHYAGVKFKKPIDEAGFRQIISAPNKTLSA